MNHNGGEMCSVLLEMVAPQFGHRNRRKVEFRQAITSGQTLKMKKRRLWFDFQGAFLLSGRDT